jgi:hypothetical protein
LEQKVTLQQDENFFELANDSVVTRTMDGIAAVGDSFTHGSCVPYNENFVAFIRDRYPATLNLGGGGNGPLLMLATLKEYGGPIKGKDGPMVLLRRQRSHGSEERKKAPLLMRYLTNSFRQGLFGQQAAIDRSLAVYVEKAEIEAAEKEKDLFDLKKIEANVSWTNWLNARIKLSHLRNRIGLVYGANRSDSAEITETEIDLFRQILVSAKASVGRWGERLYFVYLPGWTRYGNVELAEKHRDRILAVVNDLGLPLIDIHSTFHAHNDPLALFPFRQPAHYNVEGHRLIAEAVLSSIGK